MSDPYEVALRRLSSLAPANNTPSYGDMYQIAGANYDRRGIFDADTLADDLQRLDTFQLVQKYGDQAGNLVHGYTAANLAFRDDMNRQAMGLDALNDFAGSVVSGTARGIGGIAALGGGLVDWSLGNSTDIGGSIARFTEESLETAHNANDSFETKGNRQARNARIAAMERESALKAQERADNGREDGLLGSLRRIGEDAISAIDIYSDTNGGLLELAGEGVGSLVVGGGLVSLGRRAGSKILSQLGGRSVLSRAAQTRALQVGDKAVVGLALASQEGGAAYSQTLLEIDGMTHDELITSSEDYRQLIEDGVPPEEAKRQLSNSAALLAAVSTLPAAMVTGAVLGKVSAAPFSRTNVGGLATGVASETLEEAIQEGNSNLISNYMVREFADNDRDIVDGVGTGVGAGALGGGLSAGGVRGPGAIASGTAWTVGTAANVAKRAATSIFDRVKAAINSGISLARDNRDAIRASWAEEGAASTESVQQSFADAAIFVSEAEAEISAGIEGAEGTEAKIAIIDRVSDGLSYDPESYLGDDAPEVVRSALEGTTTQLEGIQALGQALKNVPKGSEDSISLANQIGLMQGRVRAVLDQVSNTQLDETDVDTSLGRAVGGVAVAMSKLSENADFNDISGLAEQTLDGVVVDPVEDADLTTPEGQQRLRNQISLAETAPERGSVESSSKILEHASSGKIQLTDNQLAAVRAQNSLLRAERDLLETKQAIGASDQVDLITGKALTMREHGKQDKMPSAAAHVRRILQAYNIGDVDTARENFGNLQRFAQHFQNKLNAINEHFAQGGGTDATGITFQALDPNEQTFVDSARPAFVNPGRESSVRLAQTIAKEAEVLTAIVNSMAEVFPDLGADQVDFTPLAEGLRGDVSAVVEQGRRAYRERLVKEKNQPAKEKPANTEATPSEQPRQITISEERIAKASDYGLSRQIERAEKGEVNLAPDTLANMKAELERRNVEKELEAVEDASETVEESQTPDASVEQAVVVDEPVTQENTEQGAELEKLREENEQLKEANAELEQSAEEEAEPDMVEEPVEEEVVDTVSLEPITTGNPDSLQAQYPDLIGNNDGSPIENRFLAAFERPKKTISRLIGMDALVFVRDALTSVGYFRSITQNDSATSLLTPDVIAAWEESLDDVQDLVAGLNKRLKDWGVTSYQKRDEDLTKQGLAARNKKRASDSDFQVDLRPRFEVLFEEGELNRTRAGRVLNLITSEGKYNQELAEIASLAAIQWLNMADRFKSFREPSDIARLLGLTEEEAEITLGSDLRNITTQFGTGLTTVEASRSLGNMIRTYWNVVGKKDAPIGETEGIPEAMAKELIEVMNKNGAIQITDPVTELLGKQDAKSGLKTPLLLKVTPLPDEHPIHKFPDAIEVLAMETPSLVFNVGAAPQAVATTQLNNERVDLSPEQKAAIRARQNVPYTANTPLISLFTRMGEYGITRLFGGGPVDPASLNERHQLTLEGRNTTMLSAYRTLKAMVARAEAEAKATDTDVSEIEFFFEYTFNSMNRQQMLGVNNPQSSKLVREAFLPTWGTIDVSDRRSKAYTTFGVILAQHLGMKVELMTPLAAKKAAFEVLGSKYAKSVGLLQEFLQNGNERDSLSAEIVDTIFEEAGGATNPGLVHALMEFARFENATKEERANFRTALYLEADGVTNGPINAMVLFTTGLFTSSWLNNVSKGGLSFGQKRTLHDISRTWGGDLYETATGALQSKISTKEKTFSQLKDREPSRQLAGLFWLMDEFLGKDARITEDGIEFERGLMKNPLTITVYGSTADGIAGKLVNTIASALYERMSDARGRMQANREMSVAEAFFPESSDPDGDLERFGRAYDRMVNRVTVVQDGVTRVLSAPKQTNWKMDFAKFNLTGPAYANMKQNMLDLIVDPMSEAINETMGEPAMSVTKSIRRATQFQSIALASEFRKEIDRMIAEKAKADPSYKDSNFLSKTDLEQAWKNVQHLQPIIDTGSQKFYLANSQRSDLASEFSGSLLDTLRTPGFVNAPADARVKGIPALTIGSGDGKMMQGYSASSEGPGRTLDVFDGLNMPIDAVEEYSQRINRAVLGSWTSNPLLGLTKSFDGFMANYDLNPEEISDELRNQMVRALFDGNERSGVTKGEVLNRLSQVQSELQFAAMSMEARQRVMKKVDLSIDQLAGNNTPFEQKGEVKIANLSQDAQLKVLNELYLQELDVVEKEMAAVIAEEVTIDEVSSIADEHSSGAQIIRPNMLPKLAENLEASGWQKGILDDTLQALKNGGFRVVTGSRKQIAAFMVAEGLPLEAVNALSREDRKVNGLTLPESKLVVLLNPSAETLVHEVIHAATFDLVKAYYDERISKNSEAGKAIARIELLMQQTLEIDVSKESPAVRRSYFEATDVIEEQLALGNKAEAVNEYMAWGLANQNLAGVLSQTKVSPLAKISRQVIDAIKKLIWGRKSGNAVLGDVLTNLRFNTAIVASAKIDPSAEFRGTALYHSESYGESTRLQQINMMFDRYVGRHLKGEFEAKGYSSEAAKKRAVSKMSLLSARAEEVTATAAAAFSMNVQERTTFQTIVMALSSSVSLDPNAMVRVGEIYRHVVRTLNVESFLKNDGTDVELDRMQAREKMGVLLGRGYYGEDEQNRSANIPAFLALAMTSPELQAKLRETEMPRSVKNFDGTIDQWLEDAGRKGMDRLGNLVSGQIENADNVQAAMDSLMDHMLKISAERSSLLEISLSRVGTKVDAVNDWVASKMEETSEVVYDQASQVLEGSSNRAVRLGAEAARAMAGITNRRLGGELAENTLSRLNISDTLPTFAKDLITDVVGRTSGNAKVYDMIKRVRSWVQQKRQEFREHLPQRIAEEFTRELSDQEWVDLYRGLGKTDIAALKSEFSMIEIIDFLRNPGTIGTEVIRLEGDLNAVEPAVAPLLIRKSKQLANFMNTGVVGTNLLRNADAIAALLQERKPKSYQASSAGTALVDKLTSLYALQRLEQGLKDRLSELAKNEEAGLGFAIAYMEGLREIELVNAKNGRGLFNHYKGSMPSEPTREGSLIVASEKDRRDLIERGYTFVGAYAGSNIDVRNRNLAYFYSPVSARAIYRQGVMQNVQETAGGVDLSTGYTRGPTTMGVISNKRAIDLIANNLSREVAKENLLPVYDNKGKIVAFERSADPAQLQRLEREEHLAKAIGQWAGRQAEEREGKQVNRQLINNLADIWDQALKDGRANEFVDLFDDRTLKADPVLRDMMENLPNHVVADIQTVFGESFMVRRDMLNDAMGYRDASSRDIFTNESRINPEVTKTVRDVVTGVFGKDAYLRMVQGENFVKNLVTDLRVLIVVKSVIVPAANLTWNTIQLASRGVPLVSMAKGFPQKLHEIDTYLKNRDREIEIGAELKVARTVLDKRRLESELKTINDMNRRLTIWPLIEAGEFTSISDDIETSEDADLRNGKLTEYFEKLVDRLPAGAQTAARYGLVSKDTALFKGLRRSIEFGDFLSKAVLYDDLTKRQNVQSSEALVMIGDEFVNYDRLPGRSRGAVEQIGLAWFWNFKLRSVKIAVSMLRNNPVHALLAMSFPFPDLFGPVGSPLTDNAFSVLVDGRAESSLGIGMGTRAPWLHPWVNLGT